METLNATQLGNIAAQNWTQLGIAALSLIILAYFLREIVRQNQENIKSKDATILDITEKNHKATLGFTEVVRNHMGDVAKAMKAIAEASRGNAEATRELKDEVRRLNDKA